MTSKLVTGIKDKLYIISETNILDTKPTLSEKAEEFISAIVKTKNDDDLLWFSGRYCTADVRNGNGDGFRLDDLKKMYEYAIFKPVNWIHSEDEKIGFIVDSQLKEEDVETYVEITGVIWCSTAHDMGYADKILEYFDKGQLGLSMETMGEKVLCSTCEKEFPIHSGNMEDPYGHYCEHLKARKVNGTTRWILEPEFSGVGIIPARGRHKPADKEAWVREIASLDEEEIRKEETSMPEKNTDVMYTKSQVDELVTSKEDAVRKEYASLEENLDSVKAEKDTLETKIVELQSDKDVKDGEISQANDEIDSLKTTITDLETKVNTYDEEKAEVEKVKFESRVAEIKAINDSVTEDVIEKLRDDILDDEKYDGVKAMFTKKEEKKSAKAKVTLETEEDLIPTESDAQVLREAFNKKDED